MCPPSIERILKVRGHPGQDVQMSLLAHLFSNTKNVDSCWIWQGSCSSVGYAQIRFDGELYTITRLVAWLTYQFDIQSELVICHSCDVRACIRPNHLFIGTYKDNMQDMLKKNRQKKRRAKPNERDLIFIKAISSGMSCREASREVGISASYGRTIKSIMIPFWEATGSLLKHERN